MRNHSSKGHEHPRILSQLCTNSDDWQCIQIHKSAEHYMRHLHSTVEVGDLRIPVHVIDCVQAGYKTCVVMSNYTDVIVPYPTVSCAKLSPKGTGELWQQAGRGTTTRFVPLHILHARLGSDDLCTVLPAPHSFTGCDITSNIGTKKAALNAEKRSTCTDLAQRLHSLLQ